MRKRREAKKEEAGLMVCNVTINTNLDTKCTMSKVNPGVCALTIQQQV